MYYRFTQWCVSYDLYSYSWTFLRTVKCVEVLKMKKSSLKLRYKNWYHPDFGHQYASSVTSVSLVPAEAQRSSSSRAWQELVHVAIWSGACRRAQLHPLQNHLGVAWAFCGVVLSLEFGPLKIFWQLKGVVLEVLDLLSAGKRQGHYFRLGCRLPSFLLWFLSFPNGDLFDLLPNPGNRISVAFFKVCTNSLLKGCKWSLWRASILGWRGQRSTQPDFHKVNTCFGSPMGFSPRSPRQYPKEVCIALEERFFTRGGRLQVELVDW